MIEDRFTYIKNGDRYILQVPLNIDGPKACITLLVSELCFVIHEDDSADKYTPRMFLDIYDKLIELNFTIEDHEDKLLYFAGISFNDISQYNLLIQWLKAI